jgi:hypothetical protein
MKLFSIRNFSKTKETINTILKCTDCKHFIPYIDDKDQKPYDGLGKCKINGYALKSGPTYFYASLCRRNELYCGEKGKFFTK